jgi:hypothetical protein
MRLARYIHCIGEFNNAYKILVENPEGKKSFE